ncbi:MAG: hypothetical protein ACYCZX_01700 [Rhodospirillaceae bacterium]
MATLYIAMSPLMQEWGADVGISKYLYKVGVTDDAAPTAAKDAVAELNAEGYGGQKDWELIGERAIDVVEPAAFTARLGERQKVIDPLYYPRIKGAKDIVKLDPRKVEANVVIKRTMAGHDSKVPKLKPADMAAYIMDSLGQSSW